ncbi:MAG: metalloregulator ArsR/SmtB family transcription factor [Gammaproteobacteria bacterium]|nr:metalloregulator ArsR/SmtB family transcription factor [Gammaproteobacteria bacterium]
MLRPNRHVMLPTAQINSASSPDPSAADLEDIVAITKAVGDPLRTNLLKILAQDSFAVLELVDIFGIAQPAMSHHLKKLAAAGLVSKRREGTHIFYQRTSPHAQGKPETTQLLSALFRAIDHSNPDASVVQSIGDIHRARIARSQHFFAHHADALDHQGKLICEPTVYIDHVIEIVTTYPNQRRPFNSALEVGPGGGKLLQALASLFQNVTGVDNSEEVLVLTRQAVTALPNVQLLRADFIDLAPNDAVDLIVAGMVIHHLSSPISFFKQAARLLSEHGLLIVAELCDHDQNWVRESCGDLWLGFSPDQLSHWATQAGFKLEHRQFLAQRNGFRIQVCAFALNRHKKHLLQSTNPVASPSTPRDTLTRPN